MLRKFSSVALAGAAALTLSFGVADTAEAISIKPTATATIQLLGSGQVSNSASVGYDPVAGLYYASRAGSSSYTANVWDNSGTLQQSLSPMNADARGWNYNANTGQMELVTFTSDLLTVGRTAAGLLTGTYTTQLNNMAGSPSSQAMLTYDSGRDRFYGYGSTGNSVSVISHTTGALQSTITLDFLSAGITDLVDHFIGYDAVEDVLVGVSGAAAYVFDLTGSYLGSSSLGMTADSNFDMGYANGQVFLLSNQLGGYQGYDIFNSTVPPRPNGVSEPAAAVLMLAGMGLLVLRRRNA
ncbi:MAG: hypothetical protein CMF31_04285 [Kordiimonas sp.]|nr:hypothetical protein [Kordiimonas sp.]|tara:strand:+ start:1007 stop:1897 length:891 start_codon:yes stop_codon:yes gene_type:complete